MESLQGAKAFTFYTGIRELPARGEVSGEDLRHLAMETSKVVLCSELAFQEQRRSPISDSSSVEEEEEESSGVEETPEVEERRGAEADVECSGKVR